MKRDTLASSAAVLMISVAAAGGDCTVLELRGESDVDLSTDATTQRRSPSLAYNVRDGEYMVVWFDTRNPGNNDIFGQRVGLDGAPIGDNVAIMEFASAQIDPFIVHNSTFNGYLAAWRTQQSGFFNKARGRLLGADGVPTSDDFFIGEGFEIALAFNAKDQEYFQTGRGSGIRGQRVSSDGNLEGGSITIATSGAPGPNGGIAYDCNSNRFFVTWRDQVDQNLKGRQFTGSGQPFGATFIISDLFPESNRAAAVAFDRSNDRYLVAFGVFQENRILGQFITTGGTRDGDAFTIADGFSSRPTPVIVWTFGEFVLAWSDAGNVVAKIVQDDGTVCDETLTVAAGSAAGGVAIAYGSAVNEVLATWVDNRNIGQGEQDIFARVLGFGTACPADLDGNGSVDFGDILAILSAWGNAGGPEDLDGSGTVDFGDLLVVLSEWGPCP